MTEPIRIEDSQAAQWAQELTLSKLANEARVSNQLLTRILSNANKTDAPELLKQLRQDVNKGLENATSAINKKSERSDTGLRDAIKDLRGSLGGNLGDLAKSLIRDSNSFVVNLGQSFNSLGQQSTKLGSAMGGAAGNSMKLVGAFSQLAGFILGSAWPVMSNLNRQFVELYASGINLNGGLSGLARASGEIGIATNDLTRNFVQFSSAVTALGSDRAVRLTREFTRLNRETGSLGMTNEMATEALLEYTEMMRSAGILRNMSDQQIISRSKEYYTELNQLSQITGKNRKEIQRSIEARTRDLSYQALLRSLPVDVQENVQKSIARLEALGSSGAQSAQKTIVSMLARGGIAGLDRSLIYTMTQTGLYDAFATLSQKAAEGADITDEMATIAEKLGDPEVFRAFKQFAGMPGPVGDFIGSLAEMAGSTENLRNSNRRLREEAMRRAEAEAKATGGVVTTDLINRKLAEVREQTARDAEAKNKDYLATQEKLRAVSQSLSSIYQSLLVDALYPLLPALKGLADVIGLVASGLGKLTDGISWLLSKIPFIGTKTVVGEGGRSEEKPSDLAQAISSIAMLAAGYGGFRLASAGIGRLIGRGGTPTPPTAGMLPTPPTAGAVPLPPAATVGSRALDLARGGLRIGGVGGLVSGASEYMSSGNLMKSIVVGGGSLIGGAIGGIGGSFVAPVAGTAVGGIGGSMLGERAGRWLYEKFGGTPTATPTAPTAPATPVTPAVESATRALQSTSETLAQTARTEATPAAGTTPGIDPTVLARKTIEYYETARADSQHMLNLLNQMIEKLDMIDQTARNQTGTLSRSFENVGDIMRR